MSRFITLLLCFGAILAAALSSTQAQETWNQLNPSGTPPSPRQGAAVVLDPRNHRMIVFGGYVGGSRTNDVYALSLTAGLEAWTQLTTQGTPPCGRSGPGAVFDSTNNRLILYGAGGDLEPLSDTWALDLTTLQWQRLYIVGPDRRWSGATVFDGAHQRMVLFGGADFNVYPINETQYLDLRTGREFWYLFHPTGTEPPRRCGMAYALNTQTNRMIVQGGWDYNTGFYTDAYSFNLTPGQEQWSFINTTGTPPSGRRDVMSCYDSLNNRLLVFGGGPSPMNDLYALNFNLNNWVQRFPSGTPPTPRYMGSVIYDGQNQRMILFGGGTGVGYLNDCWELSLPRVQVESGGKKTLETSEAKVVSVHPNPTRREIIFEYVSPKESVVSLRIFDVSGRKVRDIKTQTNLSGINRLVWDGTTGDHSACPSGCYLFELSVGEKTFRGKVTKTR